MKRVLAIILTAVLLLGVMPVVSFATDIVDSGACGENLTWTLDDEGTLTISGTGDMRNYEANSLVILYGSTRSAKTVVIEDGVTSIGNYAFHNCSQLSSVTIPDSVTSIGDSAFNNCSSLTSVTIPNGVTSIGNYVFNNCSSLTSMTIPNGVTSIGDYAFSYSGLTSVTIPESVTSIGNSAFYWCRNLKHVEITDISAWCNIEFENSSSNPLSNNNATYNDACLYLNGQLVTDLIIPESVTTVKDYVFDSYYGLTSVVIPSSVTSIGDKAFFACEKLNSVTIPNSVTKIGDNAFFQCSSLMSIEIPDSVISIGVGVFGFCFNLHIKCYKNTPVHTYAEENGFAYGLIDGTEEDNTFSGSVGRLTWSIDRLNCILTIDCVGAMPAFSSTSSGSDAPWYSYEKYVRKTIITEGTSSISANAFFGCYYMTEISIPDSVTSIGDYAFRNCSRLTNVTIPSHVTTIGDYAYASTGLTEVTIPESVTSIEGFAFSQCGNLKNVIIYGNITKMGGSVFKECGKLTGLVLTEGIKTINGSAFALCTSLTSVEIPASVNDVYGNAFANCSALESVYFFNPNCAIRAGATPANATVYGYSGSTAETYADQNGLRFMEIDGHEHHYTVTKTVEPTCTEDGFKNLSCPCGERTTEIIPANGHTEIIVPAKAATCTEGGYAEWSYCEVCGATLTEKMETAAKDHTPVTKGAYAATCDKAGFTGVTYCTECKEVLDAGEPISATNEHTLGEALEIIVTAATCTEAGTSKTIVKCSACGETLNETTKTISALGHSDANGDEKCDRCNTNMPKNTDTAKRSNAFDFLIQFFKTIADFFKKLFK